MVQIWIFTIVSFLATGCQFGFLSTEVPEEAAGVKIIRKPLAADLVPIQLQLKAPSTTKWKECSSAFSVVLRSIKNVASGLSDDSQLALKSIKGAQFYSDSACSKQISLVPLPAQHASAEFYIKAVNEGEDSIEVSGTNLKSASATLQVTRVAASMVFTGPNQLIKSNCSSAYRVSLKDFEGNPFVTKSAIQVYITGATVYADAGCYSATTGSRVISPNTYYTDFYLGPTAGGKIDLSVSAYGMDDVQISNIIVLDSLSINPVSSVPSFINNSCGAVPFTISPKMGASVATLNQNLLVNLSGPQFYTTAGCGGSPISSVTINAGSDKSIPLYVRPPATNTATLSASAGAPYPISGQTNPIRVVNGLNVSFSAAVDSLLPGVCSSVALSVKSQSGGLDTQVPEPLSVSLSAANASFFSDAACANSVASVNIPAFSDRINGIYVRVASNASSVSLQASAVGLNNGTLSVALINQLALSLSQSLNSLTREVCAPAQFILSAQSGGVNRNLSSALPVTVTQSPNGVAFFSNNTCTNGLGGIVIPSGSSSFSFYVKVSANISQAGLTFSATGNAFIGNTTFNKAVVNEILLSGPSSVLRYSCQATPVSAMARSGGSAQNLSGDLSLTFTGDTSYLFTDSGCTSPFGGSLVIGAGSNQANLYVKAGSSQGALLNLTANPSPFAISPLSISVTEDPFGFDPNFGQAGVANRDLGGTSEVSGLVYHSTSNRYLFTGKNHSTGTDQIILGRFSSGGQFDSFFGGVMGTASMTESWGNAIATSGSSIFLAGSVKMNGNSHHDFLIQKYSSSGLLTTSRSFDFGATEEEEATSLFVSGATLYVIGNRVVSGVAQIAVFRSDLNLNSQTALASYGEAGRNLFPVAVAPITNGFIVAAKVITSGVSSFGLYRFDLSGNVDTSFSQNAVVNFSVAAEPTAIVFDGSTAMVVGNSAQGIVAARVLLSGAPDTSFGNQGKLEISGNPSDRGYGLVRESSGSYVVIGGNGTQVVAQRISAGGSVGLRRTKAFGLGNTEEARSIMPNGDGTMMILGTARNGNGNSSIAAARLLP